MTISAPASASSHVAGSPYVIAASGAVDSDYSIDYAAGVLTVTPAPLTIVGLDASMVAGQAAPSLNVNYSGLVLGQGPSVLSGTLSVRTTATMASPAGFYPIIPGGLSSSDYAISFVDGTLVVSPPPIPVVTVESRHWQAVMQGRKKVKELVVSFSGALNAGAAGNLAAYTLDSAKNKKKPIAYTKRVPLSSATYSASNNTVVLVPRGTPPAQTTELTIYSADLLDAEGRELDGNYDGQPGGIFVHTLPSNGVISPAGAQLEASAGTVAAAIDAMMADGSFAVMMRREHGGRRVGR
jgi:hypothetical protein